MAAHDVDPDGPVNLRDVGGLATEDGRRVRPAVLYRGEAPGSDSAGSAGVPVWPPATVIDLRASQERGRPHALAGLATVHHVPLGTSLAPAAGGRVPDIDVPSTYRLLVAEAAERIAGIVELVAHAPGPVLVHCTAGKDRTGIVLAVLLRAVGVRRAEILADYARTEAALPSLLTALLRSGQVPPDTRQLGNVRPDAMEALLDDLESGSGGVCGWLATRGVPPATLTGLGARLVGGPRRQGLLSSQSQNTDRDVDHGGWQR